jgi:recombination protein RecA
MIVHFALFVKGVLVISRKGVDGDIEGLIQESVGSRAVRRLTDTPLSRDVPSIPTGFPSLDKALGVGGIPRGRVVEIFGPEASAVSTLIATG